MTRWIAVVGGLLFLALGHQVAAQFSVLPIYDTFDSREIDPARWVISAPRQLYETAVYQRGRKLHIESRGYGGTDTNTGLAETGRILVSVPRDAALALNAIEVTTRINSAEVTDCAANAGPTPGHSVVRLSATLFNDGDSSGGFDRTGDVHTFVNIHVAPSGPFEVFYQALRCNNGNCSSQTTVPDGFGQFTPVDLHENVTLRIERQVTTSQIIFSATNQTTGVVDTASIFVPPFVTQDPIPPERQFKEVDVSHRLENCTAERTAGSIDVSFDDFRAGE